MWHDGVLCRFPLLLANPRSLIPHNPEEVYGLPLPLLCHYRCQGICSMPRSRTPSPLPLLASLSSPRVKKSPMDKQALLSLQEVPDSAASRDGASEKVGVEVSPGQRTSPPAVVVGNSRSVNQTGGNSDTAAAEAQFSAAFARGLELARTDGLEVGESAQARKQPGAKQRLEIPGGRIPRAKSASSLRWVGAGCQVISRMVYGHANTRVSRDCARLMMTCFH